MAADVARGDGSDPTVARVAPVPTDASIGAAVTAVWDLTLLLREACPWDQVQTAMTIVPHTIEEAYEVAAAAREAQEDGNVPALVDELGDLLFQVTFLAMWCAEQTPDSDLRAVADGVREKLVRRHPHVFGAANADSADDVRSSWDEIKRTVEGHGADETGVFAGVSDGLPPLQLATKLQSRAAKTGFDFASTRAALDKVDEEVAELRAELDRVELAGESATASENTPPDPRVEAELGDTLFALVNAARLSRVDPDFALQGASTRFRARVAGAERLATESGTDFAVLDLEAQETLYQRAKATQS